MSARSRAIVWATRAVSAARSSGSAHSARQPAGQAPGGRALGLDQRAQREQHVGQRLAGDRALARHLVAAQRPGELAAARRAPGDERAEGAQLVLLVGRRSTIGSSPRAAEGAERERLPRRAAGARPGQRPEADARAVVEAQRGEQPAQAHAGVGDRRRVAGGRLPAHDDEQVRAPRARRPQGVGGRVLGEGVALHERQPLAERHLGRGDLDARAAAR